MGGGSSARVPDGGPSGLLQRGLRALRQAQRRRGAPDPAAEPAGASGGGAEEQAWRALAEGAQRVRGRCGEELAPPAVASTRAASSSPDAAAAARPPEVRISPTSLFPPRSPPPPGGGERG